MVLIAVEIVFLVSAFLAPRFRSSVKHEFKIMKRPKVPITMHFHVHDLQSVGSVLHIEARAVQKADWQTMFLTINQTLRATENGDMLLLSSRSRTVALGFEDGDVESVTFDLVRERVARKYKDISCDITVDGNVEDIEKFHLEWVRYSSRAAGIVQRVDWGMGLVTVYVLIIFALNNYQNGMIDAGMKQCGILLLAVLGLMGRIVSNLAFSAFMFCVKLRLVSELDGSSLHNRFVEKGLLFAQEILIYLSDNEKVRVIGQWTYIVLLSGLILWAEVPRARNMRPMFYRMLAIVSVVGSFMTGIVFTSLDALKFSLVPSIGYKALFWLIGLAMACGDLCVKVPGELESVRDRPSEDSSVSGLRATFDYHE